MRPLTLITSAVAIVLPSLAAAQTTQWPEYTVEQRWDRSARFSSLGTVAAIAYAKAQDTDLEEFGKWWADLFTASWGEPGSRGPVEVMTAIRYNLLSWRGMRFEILSQTETAVTARFSRPWTVYFGEGGNWYGVTLGEYETLNSMVFKHMADYHGLAFEERREGENWVLTYARR